MSTEEFPSSHLLANVSINRANVSNDENTYTLVYEITMRWTNINPTTSLVVCGEYPNEHTALKKERTVYFAFDSRIFWDRRKASQSWVMQTHMKQKDKMQLSHLLPVVGLTFQGSASHPLQCGYLNAFELQPRLIISFPNFTFIQSPSFFSSSQEMLLSTYQFQVAGCVRDPFNCIISWGLSTAQMKGVQDSNQCEVGRNGGFYFLV